MAPQLARIGAAQALGNERLRRLHGDERLALECLDDVTSLDPLHRVLQREDRYRSGGALRQPVEHSLDDELRYERPRSVVDENDQRLGRDLGEPGRDRVGSRRAARYDRGDLGHDKLLGQQDRLLLPLGRRDHDDRIDPVRGVQSLEALCQQRPTTECGECLGAVGAKPSPFPAATRMHQVAFPALPEPLGLESFTSTNVEKNPIGRLCRPMGSETCCSS